MTDKEPEKEKNKEDTPSSAPTEKIISRVIEDEMKTSYLGYAMSVIVGRALPDVRDGLKPVHRRILFAMNEMGMLHNKPFKKSARIVGEVLGKYHPHGDTAVYDTLVRMAQDFSLRYTLINGQGNFGSIDGDNAAAMRYTEARLSKIAEELLVDIDKNTVDFQANFDGSLKEPVVLPGKIPNLLINGSSGIAVGMATNIPPHNMGEIIDGVVHIIENPDAEISELMAFVKGPDFPTAGIIKGASGIKQAYKTGRGKVTVKAKTSLDEYKGKNRIIITEIPYQVNKAHLVEQIADLVREKKIEGISNIRDESDREGIRVIVELKKDVNSDLVQNQLFKYTRLTTTFGIIMIALVNNEPKVLNLKEIIEHYISYRKEVTIRKTTFELKKAEERKHILEGLIIALNNIDKIVAGIKSSKDVEEAKNFLMDEYSLTDVQAKAILDMKLQKLASLEQDKIKTEHKELVDLIKGLQEILASEQKVLNIIKEELAELKEKYADDRRTLIDETEDVDMEIEDLIKEEEVVVTVTHSGYIKRTPTTTYKQQQRGGRGVIAAGKKDEDFVEHLFVASTHSYILFFTDKGKVYWLKVHQIPEASRQAKGKAIINLIKIDSGEKISALVPVREFDDKHYLMLATKKGTIKKTNLIEYSRPRQGGIIAITLEQEDELVNALLTDGNKQVLIGTKNGMAVKFNEQDARPIGRASKGVRGVSLRQGDEVIGSIIANDEKTILTVTENGFGKRTKISDYRLTNRGGVGVINIQCSERNGKVVAIKAVEELDEVMLISRNGIVIRTPVKGISNIGRNTQGVKLMNLESSDAVVSAAKIVNE